MAGVRAPVLIDGSFGEGGGALLRTVLTLSAVTQQPVHVSNIRAATKFPGLNSEDLTLLKALAQCCDAELEGATIHSAELGFAPQKRPSGFNGNTKIWEDEGNDAFANALVVLNSLLPIAARSGVFSSLTVEGETYGHNILSFDYFANVTLSMQSRFGLYATSRLRRAGFGRYSRGEASLEVEPSGLSGIDWQERGDLIACRSVIATASVAGSVGERGLSHLAKLGKNAGLSVDGETYEVPSKSPGAFVTIWAQFEKGLGGATAMGIKGVRIEAIVQRAFDAFYGWLRSDATVDTHLADQILLTAALADGDTTYTVNNLSQRFLTMAWATKQFLPIRLTVAGHEGGPGEVSIRR